MNGPHLDRDTYLRLRAGTLDPRTARALAEHLDRGCDTCEAFLAATPPDALDGSVDAVLTSLAPGAAHEAGHDLEFARVQRALARRRWLGTRLVALAAAAALVAGVSVQVVRERGAHAPAGDLEKGAALAFPARLRFAVVEGADATRLERGWSGMTVSHSARLAFRAEVGGPTFLALVRVGAGDREVVWRGKAERAGALDVSEDGRIAAYPLQGLAGPQRFVLVASNRPLAEDELTAAARAASDPAASREGMAGEPLGVDAVEVTVN